MKKPIAIFFILLANIILLVHAVVPHHHHESSVCIEKTLCSNCDTHKHEISKKDCCHHDENNSQSCLLKLVVYLPSNQETQECKWLNSFEKHSQSGNFHAILVTHELISVIPDIISDAQISTNITPYSNFVSASKGLRAPPVV